MAKPETVEKSCGSCWCIMMIFFWCVLGLGVNAYNQNNDPRRCTDAKMRVTYYDRCLFDYPICQMTPAAFKDLRKHEKFLAACIEEKK